MFPKIIYKFALLILFVAGFSPPVCGACSIPAAHANSAPPIIRLRDMIIFRTNGLQLDFDGSPHAYGVRDQGQENICAGLAPLSPPCHGKYQGACYAVCQKTFAAWSRQHIDPKRIALTMCSVGLGGSGCSKPDVRLQPAPNQEWFVSETSLKTKPPSGPIDSTWLLGQSAQLDPDAVPYLVVPGSLTRPPWNAKFGDVGIAFSALGGELVPFIVGDGGGLVEGSKSLLAALRPDVPPKLVATRSALGDEVMRYRSGVTGDFRIVVLLGTASLAEGRRNVTQQTASELGAWISSNANETFRKRSDRAEVIACSDDLPAITK